MSAESDTLSSKSFENQDVDHTGRKLIMKKEKPTVVKAKMKGLT